MARMDETRTRDLYSDSLQRLTNTRGPPKADSRAKAAIEIVIDRCHQKGRWPLNLPNHEYIPLEMGDRCQHGGTQIAAISGSGVAIWNILKSKVESFVPADRNRKNG